jgi:inner membrane transporter RhtA
MVSLQFSSAFVQDLFERTGPAGAALLRILLSAALLSIVARPSMALFRSHWRLLLLYGAVLAVMQLAFYEAIARLPLGVVVTLDFTGPLLVGLCCSRKGLDVLWILLAGTGIVLLGGIHTLSDPVGVVASLVTGAALAGYVLLGSAVSRVTSELSGLAMAMAVASVVAVPGAAFIGLPAVGELVSPTILLAALGLALFATVVPFSLEYLALRHMPHRVFVVLVTLEPAIAALVGFLVLRQVLSGPQWIAMACVVVAALGATRELSRKKPNDNHNRARADTAAR